MDITTVDIAKAARERIKEPEHWTKGCDARDAKGMDVNHEDASDPVCWCISGAVLWALWTMSEDASAAGEVVHTAAMVKSRDRVWAVSDLIANAASYRGMVGFNDAECTTHADALEFMDTLVSILEKEAA